MPSAPADVLALLRHSVFADLGESVLASVAAQLRSHRIGGGESLFRAGDAAERLYLLRNGSIGLFRPPQAGGRAHLAGIVGRGEALGLTALLLGQRHGIDARALRDSELVYLSQRGYARLLYRHPRAILGSARVALRNALARRGEEPRIRPRTFALLPFDRHVPVRALAGDLRKLLEPFGETLLIDAAAGRGQAPGWFAERESRARFVLYLDQGLDRDWRALCLRQADAVLAVAQAERAAAPWPDLATMDRHADLLRPRHLLLLHPRAGIVAGTAARWSEALEHSAELHHVRHGDDLARVARLLARRSTGLVLSGGGARGFAAIGVLRALREAGISIDRVGGTSMGAMIAAGVALGWDDQELRQRFRAAFVERQPLSDWTLPLIALLRGERASRLLQDHFGLGDIQDLPLPYFCVSADLTAGEARVHRRGRLWHALRAASSIPGLLPPVLEDGHVLVDGAVINDLPIDVMYDHGMARILACDIRAEGALSTQLEQAWSPSLWRQWQQRHQRPGFISILLRTGMVNATTSADHRRELASELFAPPLGEIGLLDFETFDQAVELGYRHACERLGA